MPVDWAMALTAASNGLKLLSDLRGVEQDFGAAEFKLKVADLTSTLADLKVALTDARDEMADKEREIERLKAAMARRDAETVTKHGHRYLKASDGTPQGPPFCPVCEHDDGVLMLTARSVMPGAGLVDCPRCKRTMKATEYIWEDQRPT